MHGKTIKRRRSVVSVVITSDLKHYQFLICSTRIVTSDQTIWRAVLPPIHADGTALSIKAFSIVGNKNVTISIKKHPLWGYMAMRRTK